MTNPGEYRDLGMLRRIRRRDFLQGVAVGVAGPSAATRRPLPAREQPSPASAAQAAYPPALTGLRGHYPDAIERFGPIERGDYARYPGIDVDTGEHYDLVIVGGGLSGLAAAYFWRRALGDNQRILVLDNHNDFGGHAKRNEFTYNGRTFIGYGGTMSISTPYPYSYTAKALIADLGIDVARNREFLERQAFDARNMVAGTFFDKEHFGEDRLVAGTGRLPWDHFFARAQLSEAARRDLTRLYGGSNPDYLAGLTVEQKVAKLARISLLSGVPADDRERDPGCAPLLHVSGRAQPQACGHSARSRGGPARIDGLRRSRAPGSRRRRNRHRPPGSQPQLARPAPQGTDRIGQHELLKTSFEQFELEIRRQLARELASGGFDPAADIVGITVNRWPWGYSYTYDTLDDPDLPPEQRPHVIGPPALRSDHNRQRRRRRSRVHQPGHRRGASGRAGAAGQPRAELTGNSRATAPSRAA
jgi:NAD(P)-binding Rossmann-like domain